MFSELRRARADVVTMNRLLPAAEQLARADGIEQPGAEHLLLAALGLPDGIAVEVLAEHGVGADGLRAAIAAQHAEALRSVGVGADDAAIAAALPAAAPPTGPYRSSGSLQTTFQRATALATSAASSLTSGHVLLAVTEAEHGTVARALRHLGVDRTTLGDDTRRRLAAR